ncbi:MAG: formylglycine-generating enzyme family protein [Bacteroidetes bacterium]|nr:formylglycine-generating enzyme family protein [Bacteroidota bacterium]
MTPGAPYTQALPSGFSFDLIPVGAGSFMMGNEEEDAYDDEQPVHQVRFNYDFFIGKYPVTQDLWMEVMGYAPNPSLFKSARRPVERVSWFDAAVFCNALNEMCGYTPCYFSDADFQTPYGKTQHVYALHDGGPVYLRPSVRGFRLPSEAEWEYAARGGPSWSGTNYSGSNQIDETGWYSGNSHDETKPVGLKMPNELGIFDMIGNVREWCEDQWHDSYEGAPDNGSAWADQEQGSDRVLRGGSWFNSAQFCRSVNRSSFDPSFRPFIVGFRLVLSIPPV